MIDNFTKTKDIVNYGSTPEAPECVPFADLKYIFLNHTHNFDSSFVYDTIYIELGYMDEQ